MIGEDRPEAGTEGDLFFGREILLPEEDHLVLEERVEQVSDDGIVEVSGKIEPPDFGTERSCDGMGFEGLRHPGPLGIDRDRRRADRPCSDDRRGVSILLHGSLDSNPLDDPSSRKDRRSTASYPVWRASAAKSGSAGSSSRSSEE